MLHIQVADARLAKGVDATDGLLRSGIVVGHLRAEQVRQRSAQTVSRHPQLPLGLSSSEANALVACDARACACRAADRAHGSYWLPPGRSGRRRGGERVGLEHAQLVQDLDHLMVHRRAVGGHRQLLVIVVQP
jgi:hypothetical protein